MIKTYIIVTNEMEYYCGKTNNVKRRMQEHLKEKSPHWFAFKKRKDIKVILVINGDYEKSIKNFGIKKYVHMINMWEYKFLKQVI